LQAGSKYGLSRAEYEIAGIHGTAVFGPDMQMNAYLRDGTWRADGFVVSRRVEDDGVVVFLDNFAWLFIREEMEAWIAEVAREFFDDVKVFASIGGFLPDDFTQDSSARDLEGRNASPVDVDVLVAPQFGDIEEFERAAESLIVAWEGVRINTRITIVYADQASFDRATREDNTVQIPEGADRYPMVTRGIWLLR